MLCVRTGYQGCLGDVLREEARVAPAFHALAGYRLFKAFIKLHAVSSLPKHEPQLVTAARYISILVVRNVYELGIRVASGGLGYHRRPARLEGRRSGLGSSSRFRSRLRCGSVSCIRGF